MATLRGFPPSNMIAPGIKFAESDLSYVAPIQSLHRAGLVGFASKGPVNLPIIITSNRQLHQIFGNAHPDEGDPLLIYAAEQYLLVANELYVVRVAQTDTVSNEQALTASVDVPSAGTVVKIESATAGPYTFDNDSFFRWKLNGVLSSKTLVVLEDTYAVDDLVDLLNDQLNSDDGIVFYTTDIDTIGVKSLWSYGIESSIELISTQYAIYGDSVLNGNPTGLGTGMTSAEVTGDVDMYPNVGYQTPGVYDLTGLLDLTIQIVVDGTDNVLIDGIVQEVSLSAIEGTSVEIADVVDAINAERVSEGGSLPGGWVAEAVGNNLKIRTIHTGRDARIRIKPDSTAEEIFGLSTDTQIGDSPEGATGDVGVASYGIVTGGENSSNAITFTINADSPGIDGNATQVRITNNENENNFSIEVFNNGVGVESLGNLTKDSSSSYYVSTYVELASNYIKISDNTDEAAAPANGVYDLSGGTDGIPANADDQDELIIGSRVGSTGIYVLSDVEAVDIDLIAAPGRSSTSVVTALLDFCQNVRLDCLAIIDPPFGLSAKEVVDWQNGTHPLNGIRFDSDFGALYWPWVKIRDTFNKVDVWVPPSGSAMAVIARSDFLGAPWEAPAGETRGIVPGIGGVYSVPTAEESDLGYGNRNCVNMIKRLSGVDSFVVWGQKTMQRKPTALDRISVRRLLFFLKKRINSNCKVLLFEPNDEIFQRKFINIVTQILREVQIGRGINDFIIKADDELNTSDVIDRNEFRAQIGIQPVRSAEFMFVEFSLHRTGSFTENSDSF